MKSDGTKSLNGGKDVAYDGFVLFQHLLPWSPHEYEFHIRIPPAPPSALPVMMPSPDGLDALVPQPSGKDHALDWKHYITVVQASDGLTATIGSSSPFPPRAPVYSDAPYPLHFRFPGIDRSTSLDGAVQM